MRERNARPHIEFMDRTDLAWAAGFWDGEGSAWLQQAKGRNTGQPCARINQSSTTGVPEVLVRFQQVAGLGVIGGPDIIPGREPLYRWMISRRRDVEDLARLLWPWLGKVKRDQIARTVEVSLVEPLSFALWSESEQRAWAAGLWDGEGCVCLLKHRTHPGYFVPEAAVTQSSEGDRPEALERLAAVAGGGYWYGPVAQPKANHLVYRWKLFRPIEIHSFFEKVRPWLAEVKRAQADAVFRTLERQPTLPRGNPAWGNRKTHCIHGHEYASARIRAFRGRGRNTEPPRDSHQCLACVREWHRVRRSRT